MLNLETTDAVNIQLQKEKFFEFLQSRFCFKGFRAGQLEAIETLFGMEEYFAYNQQGMVNHFYISYQA